MPRERGLNYTPDADGYSFDDTAIGEAAQASFHRLASGYPQQEPDDIHHLADVITGIRDSTFADMELRKASGLYSMTQARTIDTILDRAGALLQHYQDRRLEQRQNERDKWADLLRDTKALLPEWDNDDVNRLIHDLDHPRDAMEPWFKYGSPTTPYWSRLTGKPSTATPRRSRSPHPTIIPRSTGTATRTTSATNTFTGISPPTWKTAPHR